MCTGVLKQYEHINILSKAAEGKIVRIEHELHWQQSNVSSQKLWPADGAKRRNGKQGQFSFQV